MIIYDNLNLEVDIVYISIFLYIMYTKIDIEFSDIILLKKNNNSFTYYYIEEFEENIFFSKLLNSVKVKTVSLDYINNDKVNIFYTEDEKEFVEYSKTLTIIILVLQKTNQLCISLNSSIFNYRQINNFNFYYIKLLKFILNNPNGKVNEYQLLSENQIYEIQESINNTEKEYDLNITIVGEFYKYLIKNPNNPCIIFKNNIFTYRDIEIESSSIANAIENLININSGVVIFIDRSQKIISSILAILKINCFYIPIDISTPVERLKSILIDAKVKILLVDDKSLNIIHKYNDFNVDVNIVNIDNISIKNKNYYINLKNTPHDPCYMIYTSGTSGKPKGVLIRNKNIANFVCNNIFLDYILNIDEACIIAANKVGFDAFVADTLLPLALGVKIVMASNDELNSPRLFVKNIKENSVNIIQTTPTRLVFSIINNEPNVLKYVKLIICGGEPLLKNLIKTIKSKTKAVLINVYGLTETTVWSTYSIVLNNEVNIGKPIPNTKCFILNRFNQLLPRYENGFLFLSGDGLGEYYFDKELQSKKFINIDGLIKNVYNTGDSAYINDNNNLVLNGRIDGQVKVNGVRIELDEIESVITEIGLLKECVVINYNIKNKGNKLVLFYTSDSIINENKLRELLRAKLPITYIPNFFIRIDKMPLTSSNKLDRQTLSKLKMVNSIEVIEPNTETEKFLVNYLRSEYPIELGIKHKLEDIGIDSLDMLTLSIKIEELANNFDIGKLKYSMTIEELANEIDCCSKIKTVKYNYPKIFFKNYKIKECSKDNILLIGASGFLGMHILNYLLNKTKSDIICFCHKRNNLENIYKQIYKMDGYDNKRIKIISSDICKVNFGLNKSELSLLNSIDEIINCAAIVKYFGDEEEFYKTNVLSVKNLLDFIDNKNIVLNHISTLSVLGKNSSIKLPENIFWHNQYEILKNQYIKSKFNAEYEIYKKQNSGIFYRIIRIGRVAWRYSDKIFQPNTNDNEFYSSLKLFKEMGMAPENIKDINVEISPVDFCAEAIVNIIFQPTINGIFHIMNNNIVTMSTIIDAMNYYDCKIEWVKEDIFVKELLDRNDPLSLRNHICINNNKYEIESNPKISNIMTKNVLDNNFFWPKINYDYFDWITK